MKAAIYTKYGPPSVLRVVEIEAPVPRDDEVLIKVHASTVNRTDCGFRSAKYVISRFVTGLTKPNYTILGSEFAGEIVAVGKEVQDYKPGDKVFGFDDVRAGGYAEYVTKPAAGCFALIPAGRTYEEMAPAGEGATYALNVIRASGIVSGQKAMVYGASGAIGSAAVQILKHLGIEVVAVCGTRGFDKVSSLGADRVINYEKEDFTQGADMYDLVFDAVGKSSYGVCKKLLTPSGKYYSSELGKGGQNPLLALWFAIRGSQRVLFPIPRINKEIVTYIAGLVQSGAYKPLVDRTYTLDEIVEATTYVETGQKLGNVVITITRE